MAHERERPQALRAVVPRRLTFNVGHLVVYPRHGVAEVVGIAHEEVAGQRQSFYALRLLAFGARFLIPINKVNQVGLREIINSVDVKRVDAILRQKDVVIDPMTWNRRFREYTEKINSGSAFEIAEVLRDLYLLKAGKELSFGERRLFDTARALLMKELSLAKNCQEEEIESDLKRIFAA